MSPFVLAEELLSLDPESTSPKDLPGRYGRTVKDLERLLVSVGASGVVAGGWAVWHHGYAGRVTEDVDIVVGEKDVTKIRQAVALFGFDYLQPPAGRWPKLTHQDTKIDVDLLPEKGIPGTQRRPAPVPIGHPESYGADPAALRYITLTGLIELKLGASRAKDVADIIELIKTHRTDLEMIRGHLSEVHRSYVDSFDDLVQQATDETSH